MDQESGFNLIQAAVFKGKYDIVLKAHGLLDNFVEEIEFLKTANKPKCFQEKTAVDILSSHLTRTTGRQTESSIQDQMLRLSSDLHW